MSVKIYQYGKCSTCRKALRFLKDQGVDFQAIDITERPPTKDELKKMLRLQDGDIKKLFNTSGQQYRELNIKDKLPSFTESKAIDLLSKNGKLVKRPFLLCGNAGAVGYKQEEWEELFGI